MSTLRWDGVSRALVSALLFCMSSSTAHAGPREVTLEGSLLYSQDQVIGELDAAGNRITDVVIRGGTHIRISGGHSLKIQARRLTLSGQGHVEVDGQGEPGAPGEPQTAEPPSLTSTLACPAEADRDLTLSDSDRGFAGNPGQQGSKGATVELLADELSAPQQLPAGSVDRAAFLALFKVNVEGGAGGPGSEGGPGRLLVCGEDPNQQRRGPPGFSGPPGPRGPNGAFSLQGEIEPAAIGVALAISGGISLGSYEAGYNWTLIRYIKSRSAGHRTPRSPPPLALVGVTGASAGSINTLLSAVTYCQAEAVDRSESPFDNLFYEAWVPVGLHSLLPADPAQYRPQDALLSRQAFSSIEEKLARRVAQAGDFVPGSCVLPLGMTVTRRDPIELMGSGLEAPVDRFSIALEARATARGLEFHDLQARDESPYAKPYLHLAPGTEPVDFGVVRKALRASSAFPVAFGMETLEYYNEKSPSQVASHEFWDGGLYDNIPISLTLSFIQKPLYNRPRFPGTVQLVALDPDRRRIPQHKQVEQQSSTQPARRGLSNLPKIAGNIFSVVRKYEIQNFIRFALPQLNSCQPTAGQRPHESGLGRGVTCINEPLVSSRYFPVYGERLGAFGAFLMESFRQFDFAAGIYDGLYSFAWVECEGAPAPSGDTTGQVGCLVRSFRRLYEELGIGKSGDAAFVVKALLRQELKEQFGPDAGGDALSWLEEVPPHKRYFEVLLEHGRQQQEQQAESGLGQDLDSTAAVLEALQAEELQTELPTVDQEFLAASSVWYQPPLSRLLRRSYRLETEEKDFLGRQLTGAALLLLQTRIANSRHGLDLDPSSIPDDHEGMGPTMLHLLPYHLTSALKQRRLEVGWRPTAGLLRNVAVGMPLSLSLNWSGTEKAYPAMHAGMALVGRFPWLALTAAELGPRMTSSKPRGTTLGAELAVHLLLGKLRLAASVDDLRGFSSGNPVLFSVGLADLNGMLYHALQ